MSLALTLNTNEVKDKAGTEVEFVRQRNTDRQVVYAKIAETPSQPYRLTVSHQETGSGLRLRRRSVVRVDKTVISGVDSATPVTPTAYIVVDAPVGALTTLDDVKNVLANVLSFCSTTGAATTVLFDCTGNGADALVNGTL